MLLFQIYCDQNKTCVNPCTTPNFSSPHSIMSCLQNRPADHLIRQCFSLSTRYNANLNYSPPHYRPSVNRLPPLTMPPSYFLGYMCLFNPYSLYSQFFSTIIFSSVPRTAVLGGGSPARAGYNVYSMRGFRTCNTSEGVPIRSPSFYTLRSGKWPYSGYTLPSRRSNTVGVFGDDCPLLDEISETKHLLNTFLRWDSCGSGLGTCSLLRQAKLGKVLII